jgi:hypothetical protein
MKLMQSLQLVHSAQISLVMINMTFYAYNMA